MKISNRSFCALPGSLVMLLTVSGCMLSPTDDQRVSNTTDALTFSGYHLNSGGSVQVRAWDFTSNAMVNLGLPVNAATTPEPGHVDVPLFYWSVSRTLGPRLWRAGPAGGQCAVTGATTTSGGRTYNLTTVESNWFGCYEANRTATGFSSECASNNHPVAKLYTRDWGSITVTQERLDLAALVASTQVRVNFDNFTPTAYQFCSSSTPENCPPGGGSDPETYKFYRPNGSFIRQGSDTLAFSIPPTRSSPMTVYIDDMASRSLDFRVQGSQFVLGINFESTGPEIRMNCIRDGRCPFVDGRTIDFASPRAEIRFTLSFTDGKLGYSAVSATFTTTTAGDEAAGAAEGIGTAMTEKLRDDPAVRRAVSDALAAILSGAAGLDPYTLEGVTVSGTTLRVRPGCPMD